MVILFFHGIFSTVFQDDRERFGESTTEGGRDDERWQGMLCVSLDRCYRRSSLSLAFFLLFLFCRLRAYDHTLGEESFSFIFSTGVSLPVGIKRFGNIGSVVGNNVIRVSSSRDTN